MASKAGQAPGSMKSVPAPPAASLVSPVPDSAKYLCEFVGTYILVLTVGMNVLGGTTVWAVASIAFSLMVMIYSLGPVSGGHFNPAVTLTVLTCNKMWGGSRGQAARQAGIFVVCQLLGGIAAGLTYSMVFGSGFSLKPGKGYTVTQAGLVEMVFTGVLCFVVLNVCCSTANKGNQYFGLAVAGTVIAGGYSVGPISGGCFNPAVALGIDLGGAGTVNFSIVYIFYELIGAAVACLLFRYVRAEDYTGRRNEIEARLLSEFLGTFVLVFTVGCAVLTGAAAAAYAIAASLMVMVYALGTVSGAHFNPAVTFAIWLSGRNQITGEDAFKYVFTQLLAGSLAGISYSTLLDRAFPLAPAGSYTLAQAFVAEWIFTALLCFVVLAVATTKVSSKDMFGFAIGSVITVGGVAIGGISGGALNPAVAFGIESATAMKGGSLWSNFATYTGAELFGALTAAGAFWSTYPMEYVGNKLP
jgi:aquaporin Z